MAAADGIKREEKNKKNEAGYKPNSVPRMRGHDHFTMDAGCPAPLATYPETMSGQPLNVSLFGLAPNGVYLALECHHPGGELLPRRFTLTQHHPGRFIFCGTFPRSPGVRVTNHPALRSSDFPPRHKAGAIMHPLHPHHSVGTEKLKGESQSGAAILYS